MYDVDQSPLYRLSTKKKLCSLLQITDAELRDLTSETERHYRFFNITKGAKVRAISHPVNAMERVHDRIFELFGRIVNPDYLHSGVKGRSCVSNARIHLGHVQCFKVDLKNFFPSVDPRRVFRLFSTTLQCAPDVAWNLCELCTTKAHLPTGSSISQVIAFATYWEMFDELHVLASAHGIRMTCYVDDLAFSGPHVTQKLQYEVTRTIRQYGLIPHKLRFFGHNDPKIITGVIVKGDRLFIRNKHLEAIYDQIAIYTGMPPGKARKQEAKRLLGRLHAAGMIDAAYKAKAVSILSLSAR